MNVDGRGQARRTFLRRVGLAGAVLAVLALLFLVSGHWILGIVLGAAAVAAIWAFVQARSVR
ncbi:MAG TPA: hypothetical protein VFA82_00725 [Gaiellaceae bacterium]|nr:hypothetical protein [Gaiellaceae bacterium]